MEEIINPAPAASPAGVSLSAVLERDHNAPIRVGLVFDGETPVAGFLIVGQDSDAYRTFMEAQRKQGVQNRINNAAKFNPKTVSGALALNEQAERGRVELACAVTVGWFGFTENGAEVPFDKGRADQAIRTHKTFVDRIETALYDAGNGVQVSNLTS